MSVDRFGNPIPQGYTYAIGDILRTTSERDAGRAALAERLPDPGV